MCMYACRSGAFRVISRFQRPTHRFRSRRPRERSCPAVREGVRAGAVELKICGVGANQSRQGRTLRPCHVLWHVPRVQACPRGARSPAASLDVSHRGLFNFRFCALSAQNAIRRRSQARQHATPVTERTCPPKPPGFGGILPPGFRTTRPRIVPVAQGKISEREFAPCSFFSLVRGRFVAMATTKLKVHLCIAASRVRGRHAGPRVTWQSRQRRRGGRVPRRRVCASL